MFQSPPLVPARLRRALLVAATCAPVLLLSACGGGDGGGSASTGATVDITAANQEAVASNALNAALSANPQVNVSFLGAMTIFYNWQQQQQQNTFARAAAASPAPAVPRFFRKPSHQGVAARAAVAAPVVAMAPTDAGPQTVQVTCLNEGGTASITNPEAVMGVGTVQVVAHNCELPVPWEEQTVTVDGTITIASAQNNTSEEERYSGTITATQFSVRLGDSTGTVDGELHQEQLWQGTTDSTVFSATRFTSSLVVAGETALSVTTTLRNFTQSTTWTEEAGAQTVIEGDIETTDSRLGGTAVTYHMSTPVPLGEQNGPYAFASGTVRIVSGRSVLLATFDGDETVLLQRDENGDGVYEGSAEVQIESLLLPMSFAVPV